MKSHAAGFTLLETLVALAVFGLLLVGLSQTVRFGLTAWREDTKLAGHKSDMEAVDRTLRTIVENYAPGGETGQPPINGSATSVLGITRLRLPGFGLTPVRAEAGLALSGSRLILRWRTFHHWTAFSAPPPPEETELMDGVAKFAVEYWGAAGVWVSTWQDPDLPLLIRFRVILAGAHAPRWPDIVVAPLLARP